VARGAPVAGREAELHPRGARRRVRVVHAGAGEAAVVRRALGELRLAVAELESNVPQSGELDAARAAAPGAGAAS
jgi:hypothetical protein